MKLKSIIAIFMIIFLITNCGLYAVSAASLEEQKSDLNNQKAETEAKQDEVQEEMSSKMKEVEALEADISNVQDEINQLNVKIDEVESSISEKTKEIEKKQEEYDKNQKLLEDRMVSLYEYGDTSFLDVLLTSSSITDFISNYYLVTQIAEFDTELLESIEKEQKEIEQAKNELENKKQELNTVKSEQETKSNELSTKKSEKQAKVNELSEEDKKLQSEIDDYNAQISKVESQIEAAYKKALEDAAKKAAQAANNNSSSSSSSSSSSNGSSNSSSSNSGSSGIKFDGSFIWPCNNKVVTSRVKMRWGRWHKGIDIGARYESVYAAASGYAYNLENPGGYGHYVMIVHGSGYITLYGHLNSFSVSSGSYVSQGQVIAQSGNSGGSTGPHLHFEIRKASSTSSFFSSSFLDPLDYLPGGYTISE